MSDGCTTMEPANSNKVVNTLAVRHTLNKEHLVTTSKLLLKLQAPLVCKVLVHDQYHGED